MTQMPNPTPYEAGPAVTRVEPTPPERIYLQWEAASDFEWSWCSERTNDTDAEYVLCRRSSSAPAVEVTGVDAARVRELLAEYESIGEAQAKLYDEPSPLIRDTILALRRLQQQGERQ